MNINNTTIDARVDHINYSFLYDKDIQEHRATRLNEITYSDFCSRHATEDAATRARIDHVTSYQQDLARHLTLCASLLDRSKQIFSSEPYWATLHERSSRHRTALISFQALITAAAIADNRKQIKGSIMSINHVYNTQHQPSQTIASG